MSAAAAAALALLAAIMSALAYALGRKQAPSAHKPEDAHDAIKALDAAIDRVAGTPTDVLARHLAERARARERALGGDPPVRD